MTPDTYRAIHAEMCRKASELTMQKGADYSGAADTLANLKACERLGICTAETGVLVRMCDKLMRLITLNRDGEEGRAVQDESLVDTELDLINYTILLGALRCERAAQATKDGGAK